MHYMKSQWKLWGIDGNSFFIPNSGEFLSDSMKQVKWHIGIKVDGTNSYNSFEFYCFKPKEVMFNNPMNVGFTFLELIKHFLCETDLDVLQPFFSYDSVELHYTGCDSSVVILISNH